jgi:hypothetical protein
MPAKVSRKSSPYQSFAFGNANIVVGAEATNVINVAVTLKDDNGRALGARASFQAWLSTRSDGGDVVGTAPTGGLAIGTNGAVIPIVTNKAFILITDTQGRVDVNITDTGTPTFYLAIQMPDGTLSVSGPITFA